MKIALVSFVGNLENLTMLLRPSRFKEVRPEIVIVQPGLSKANITREQSVVLGTAVTYLKQTVDVNLDIIVVANVFWALLRRHKY